MAVFGKLKPRAEKKNERSKNTRLTLANASDACLEE
jgi:hypothetical protein